MYLLNGVFAALAGVVLTARLNAGMTSAGENYELDAIAACVIGGTSMSGGSGKVSGAILGTFIMASITNEISMMNMESLWQYIAKEIILVAGV
jgi:D-xylose transport system permease protein